MKTRNFEELRAKMSPKARKQAELKAELAIAGLLLARAKPRGSAKATKPASEK